MLQLFRDEPPGLHGRLGLVAAVPPVRARPGRVLITTAHGAGRGQEKYEKLVLKCLQITFFLHRTLSLSCGRSYEDFGGRRSECEEENLVIIVRMLSKLVI